MMLNFFAVKWISFYGATIAIVIALFSATTNYGETHLKAPPKIAGRYRINAKTLPGCLKSETLVLSIEQSGVYLSGSLLKTNETTRTETAARKKPPLTGSWKNQILELSGVPFHLQSCTQQQPRIEIHGSVANNEIQGELKLNNQSVQFSAQREEIQEK